MTRATIESQERSEYFLVGENGNKLSGGNKKELRLLEPY